jgi:hypothetical protein
LKSNGLLLQMIALVALKERYETFGHATKHSQDRVTNRPMKLVDRQIPKCLYWTSLGWGWQAARKRRAEISLLINKNAWLLAQASDLSCVSTTRAAPCYLCFI